MSCFYLFIIYLCYETISEYNSLALHVEINVLFWLCGLRSFLSVCIERWMDEATSCTFFSFFQVAKEVDAVADLFRNRMTAMSQLDKRDFFFFWWHLMIFLFWVLNFFKSWISWILNFKSWILYVLMSIFTIADMLLYVYISQVWLY